MSYEENTEQSCKVTNMAFGLDFAGLGKQSEQNLALVQGGRECRGKTPVWIL